MNRLSHASALLAGLALIVLVNVVALGGVAWNRGAEDSRLRLSQRELRLPLQRHDNDEQPGVALQLELHPDRDYNATTWLEETPRNLRWLDEKKLAELGFEVARPPRERNAYEVRSRKREVVLVLELGGPRFVDELAAETRRLRAAQATVAKYRAANPDLDFSAESRTAVTEVKAAAEELRQTALEESRLFAVDAGLDAAALRRRYPDRRHYALVRGIVTYSPYWRKSEFVQDAYVALLNPGVNLPRPLLDSLVLSPDMPWLDTPLAVDIAFGRRLEPWIVGAKRGAAPR